MDSSNLGVSIMQNTTQTTTLVITIKCCLCHQLPKNHKEVLEINEFGYHLTCDHVMADVNDQRKDDYENQA